MLSLVAAKELRPEVEALDTDPGILSLIAAFTRFTARQTASTVRSIKTFNQRVKAAEAFSSSTAWPYYDRSR